MIAYELQRIRTDDLLREAAEGRLVREARVARRAARRQARNAGENRAHPLRDRFVHAA